jgi:hypothetical protein
MSFKAARPLPILARILIGEPGWADEAIEELLNSDGILLVDAGTGRQVHVDAEACRRRPRTPAWAIIRAELRAAGIRAPRVRW